MRNRGYLYFYLYFLFVRKTNSKENLKISSIQLTSFFFSVIRSAICDGGEIWKLLHLISDPWSLMMRP